MGGNVINITVLGSWIVKKIKFSVKEKTKQSGGYWGEKTPS